MSGQFDQSYIFSGIVIHKRYVPKKHSFNSSLFMLALDADDVERGNKSHGIFGFSWFHPLRFVEKDYLLGDPIPLSQRIKNKVDTLGGHQDISQILMLVQVRCFGFYFSPVNFYFCYNDEGFCTQMLAEVSNTPWNERHYYLVDLLDDSEDKICEKVFQVSPFMDLDMDYQWTVKPPQFDDNKLLVKIENKRTDKVSGSVNKLFEASLILKKSDFSKRNLMKIWVQLPVMTVKIVIGIYWEALKLFIKRIPFVGYQTSSK